MNTPSPSIVVMGGGTGTYTVLSGLRDRKVAVTALLTMVDDGGSNRVLRDEFGLLPTSGVRQAIVALSEKQGLLRELFLYRFHQGNGISGMTFGNLFLAAVSDIVGSQKEAIKQTAELFSVKGRILPISYDDVRLVATYEDGSTVVGEHLIDEPQHDGTLKITELSTKPEAKITDEARDALLEADMIVLGPGDFYTNTIANLIVTGVKEALMKSRAQIVFVVNLMTKYGEAYDYTAADYIHDLGSYLPLERLNGIIINTDVQYPDDALRIYEEYRSIPVVDNLERVKLPHTTIVRQDILSHRIEETQKGDALQRSIIRHDPEKLADALLSFFQKS